MIKIIFGLLCGLLYCIGLCFGWNYQETSVYFCIYLWPVLCVLSTLPITVGLIHRIVIDKGRWLSVLALPFAWLYTTCYVCFTILIYNYYQGSVPQIYNKCMNDLQRIAAECNTTYEDVNIAIYIYLFALILLVNGILAYIAKPYHKRWRELVSNREKQKIIMKRSLLILVAIVLVVYVVLSAFSLVKTADRPATNYQLPKELKERITNETQGMDEMDIVNYGLRLTGKLLDFSEKNNLKGGKANCVGYAQLCASITNYGLKTNKREGSCKPVVGYVTWAGMNLCTILSDIVPNEYNNFVKDHVFVECNLKDKTIFFDPSIYDYLGTKALTTINR